MLKSLIKQKWSSLVFFPFKKNYAALAVVVSRLPGKVFGEGEGGLGEPERRDHGGTAWTGHPT